MYKTIPGSTLIYRTSDGAYIPNDPENADYRDYLSWVALGNTAAPRTFAPTANDVITERKRRLALGFNYDFGDARGIHHFSTSEADMVGWDDVSTISNAAMALGLPTTSIDIITDTGAVTVTAAEWQQILLHAGQVRQPIWSGSFYLQSLDPIPSDYTDDDYWS